MAAVDLAQDAAQGRSTAQAASARAGSAIILVSYLFLSPWIIGFVVFMAGPMIASFYLSFTDYEVVQPPVWVGLDNYMRMAQDSLFFNSLSVTVQVHAVRQCRWAS